MRFLADTHLVLWWLNNSPQLPEAARRWMADPENTVFVSAATVWEIRIKQGLGKIVLPEGFDEVLGASGFELLPVHHRHAHAVRELPRIHRDPFDRMLVAQARVERLELVTANAAMAGYGPPVILVR